MTKKKPLQSVSRRARELAGECIAQEIRVRKHPRRQAVAIGLSRSRQLAAQEKIDAVVAKYL
jgi:hypothetical protein